MQSIFITYKVSLRKS